MAQDLRAALKFVRKRPFFALTVFLILSLGIAVNATGFSVIDTLILGPLPFPESGNLVVPVTIDLTKRMKRGAVAYSDFLEWRRQKDLFEGVALVDIGDYDLVGGGDPEKVDGAAVSEDYFLLLRSKPLLGRGLVPGDFQPSAEKALILSDGLWQRRFGGRPDVLGTTVRLGDTAYKIVGVFAAMDASLLDRHSLWIPLDLGFPVPAERLEPDAFAFRAIARLKPGVSLAQAQARLTTLAARVAQDEPEKRGKVKIGLMPLKEWLIKPEVQIAVMTIFLAILLSLLIVCFNIAGLLLVRAAERQKEIAIRLALGAQRSQLMRQLLAESLALSIPGGIAGVILSRWGMDLFKAMSPPRLPLDRLGLDASVLLFAVALSLLTALVMGLMPALQLTNSPLENFLRDGGSGAGSHRRLRKKQSVVLAAEIAISLVLLTLAGMAVRNIAELLQREGGVQVENRLTMEVELPETRYPDQAQREKIFRGLVERIGQMSQVRTAAASSSLPLGGGGPRVRFSVLPEGQPDPPAGKELLTFTTTITPDYFRAMGIPLLQGRSVTEQDKAESGRVLVVSQAMAEQLFPGQNALGKRIRQTGETDLYEIVGVVGNVRYQGLGDDWEAMSYRPYRQARQPTLEKLIVHASGDPLSLMPAIRKEVWRVDPTLPISQVRTLEEIAAASIQVSRRASILLSALSAFALLLTAIGLYGIVSYTVARRTQEIGVRLALGARGRDVTGMVIRQGLVLCLAGAVIGLLAAPILSAGFEEVLVVGGSPVIYVLAALLLALVVVAASLGPARKAMRISPAEALRYE